MSKSVKGLIGLALVILVAFLAISFLTREAPQKKTAVTHQEAPAVQQEKPAAEKKGEEQAKKAPEAGRPKVTREFKDGTDYRTLKTPVKTDVAPGQVEVISIFWYGCPHCYSLEPIVSRWHKTLPADVSFVQMPGFFGPNLWQTHAQLYYTIFNMGLVDKVHEGIFNEVQNKRNLLKDSGEMAEFLNRRYGVDKKAFIDQFNSFGVNVQLQQAFSRLKGYELKGVPALIIDGRYVVESGLARSLDNMPIIADFLINKVKKERALEAKKPKG